MKQQTIEVHIDRIVLQGFSSANRHEIAAAVQQELNRLFQQEGIPPSLKQGGSRPELHGNNISLNSRERGLTTGSKIADSVYHAFSNEQPAKRK